jgi:hypothetical protein
MNKAQLRALAAQAASGATVTKVPEGNSLGLTSKEWRQIVQSPTRVSLTDGDRSERIAEGRFELGCAAAQAGDRDFAAEVAGGMHDHLFGD